MSGLFLLIPEIALREAVAEQIKAAKLGEPRLIDTAQDWVKQHAGSGTDIVIIDDAGDQTKTADLLQRFGQASERPTILMLGGTDDADGVTETFAKPFRLGHLMTRLRYYMETAPGLRECVITFGPFRLEPQNRRILCGGETDTIRLTEKETALLVFLAQNKEPATRQDILASVWGYDERIDTHTLETHIYQLRRKLGSEGENWLIFDAGAYRLARGQEE